MWKTIDGKLTREFVFTDFQEEFAFMTKVEVIAEEVGHHPEWTNI